MPGGELAKFIGVRDGRGKRVWKSCAALCQDNCLAGKETQLWIQLNRLDIPILQRLRFYGCGKAALAHYMEFFLMSDFDNEKL